LAELWLKEPVISVCLVVMAPLMLGADTTSVSRVNAVCLPTFLPV
jgi:hypothetical protein